MMRARVNLITADPDRMADTIGYIKNSVRPAIDSMDGSLGLSLYGAPPRPRGRVVLIRIMS